MERVTRREAVAAGVAGVLGVGTSTAPADGSIASDQGEHPPLNVLHINTDQQRFDALGCADGLEVETPNLDRLAREGVRFSYAITPQPMCVAARCSLHTGLSIFTTGCTVTFENPQNWSFGAGSWDQCLERVGYHCEYHGRWHAPLPLASAYRNPVDLAFIPPYQAWLRERRGEPRKPGIGEYRDTISGWPYTPDPCDYNLRKDRSDMPGHKTPLVEYGVTDLAPEHTFSGYVADRLIDALRRLGGRRYSLHGAILHPHHPQQVTRKWAGSVRPEGVRLPETLHDRRSNTPFEQAAFQLDATEMRHAGLIRARYCELVQEVDEQVGRVLKELDTLGLADRTLVVFTADHGEFLGDHGLTQKFYPYQEAIRVPLIMRLPGRIPAGRVIDRPVNLTDVHATILDYLGHGDEGRANRESRSLRPLIDGKARGFRAQTFTEMANWHAIVSSEWKYVWTPDPAAPDLLYDLKRDPREVNNLLGTNPERSRFVARARSLRKQMLDWMESIGHPRRDALAASQIG